MCTGSPMWKTVKTGVNKSVVHNVMTIFLKYIWRIFTIQFFRFITDWSITGALRQFLLKIVLRGDIWIFLFASPLKSLDSLQSRKEHFQAEKVIFVKMNFKKVGKVSKNWPTNPPGPIFHFLPRPLFQMGDRFRSFETPGPGHHGAPRAPCGRHPRQCKF